MRVALENITPRIPGDPGCRIKRIAGEEVCVEADIFADGHDLLRAIVQHRAEASSRWQEAPMHDAGGDRWRGSFRPQRPGAHEFRVVAWIDRFGTWRRDLGKRLDAGQDVGVELLVGAELVQSAADSTVPADAELRSRAEHLRTGDRAARVEGALDRRLAVLMEQRDERRFAAVSRPMLLWADRPLARCSAWYELFPRSASGDPSRHGTFDDVAAQLDRIADMGFDVLYLPPIHPIGRTHRKGKNNALDALPDDVGSPWAIGGPEGGHDAVHPSLGTPERFVRLVHEARDRGIDIAMDLALQCSPDHPYVRAHPDWFRRLPDGTIRYAENPPKKYQDIYPFDFECPDWRSLWGEILRVVLVWVDRGVRVFRVDNPHTKPFALWEWLIAQVQARDPGVLFLGEAFTRPRVMERLAKVGFTQSYTYFTWRTDPHALREYFSSLARPPSVDFFRPNAWPNTPDILPEHLQHAGRPAFIARAVLASTLCASWGVYGPAFELMEHRPVRPGSEEYLDSEKYQLRAWDTARPDSLAPLLRTLNTARRENPALQQDRTLRFHHCDNPSIICYSKSAGDNAVLVAVSTDTSRPQWGTLSLDLGALGVCPDTPYQAHDLLTGARYRWRGPHPVVGLDPADAPAHVLRIRRSTGAEAGFEYFV